MSKQLTLLGQVGSVVSLGAVQILPIAGSLLYVRPLYVSSAQTQLPELRDVVILYGQQVAMAPTLDEALAQVFGAAAGATSPSGSNPSPGAAQPASSASAIPGKVRRLVAEASAAYSAGQKDLVRGNLGAYQHQIEEAGRDLVAAQRLLTATTAGAKKPRAVQRSAPATTSLRIASVPNSDASVRRSVATASGPRPSAKVPSRTRSAQYKAGDA